MRAITVLAMIVLAVLAGCTAGGSEGDGAPPGGRSGSSYHRYVALGDSFTAGPYVPDTDLAGGCLRSDGNYPALVAARLDVEKLVDVSCGGANTGHLQRPQNTFRDAFVPAQLDAVTEDTDLVTLGIGGNDFHVFGTLVRTCTRLRGIDPTGDPCRRFLDAQGTDLIGETDLIGRRVAGSVRRIQEQAPDATVLLIGYPRLAPDRGTCPGLLPLADGDYDFVRQVARSLDSALQRAAQSTGVRMVDMYDASRGHDICSEDPWVNGQTTDQAAALSFHPFASEMDAVADRVVALLH